MKIHKTRKPANEDLGVVAIMGLDVYVATIKEEYQGKIVENTYLVFYGEKGKRPMLLLQFGDEPKMGVPSPAVKKDLERKIRATKKTQEATKQETPKVSSQLDLLTDLKTEAQDENQTDA